MPIVTQTEISKLNSFNATDSPFPQVCAHYLIEEIALKQPHATALEWEPDGTIWSYEQLNRTANVLVISY
jgi:hypothetical protein